MKVACCYEYEIGSVTVVELDGKITAVQFGRGVFPDMVIQETPILIEAKQQLSEYFSGRRKQFDLPLAMEGTCFQKQVWEALLAIPYGETRSYKQIAESVGHPNAYRAVGMANHVNPIGIVVPCHRVVGSNGKLTGYAGGMEVKQFLLDLESRFC